MSNDPVPAVDAPEPLSTGIPGLDQILVGGLARSRFYLVEGTPGTGKTTLALQFLITGAARGEPVLYVTLSETRAELRAVAGSHGWSLEGIEVIEVLPPEDILRQEAQYTVFHPTEVELAQTTRTIVDAVERLQPVRVVIDSLSELRLLAGSALRYRQQVLALKQFFAARGTTALVLDDRAVTDEDSQVQSIAHGIVLLEQTHPEYGRERRRIRIGKYRGVDFVGGFHDYRIRRGGLEVYPRLVPSAQRAARRREGIASTGLPALDVLLGGGLQRGTSTLISGAPGTGKSSLAMQAAIGAASRGELASLFLFDESAQTLQARARGLSMPIDAMLEASLLRIHEVDPAELSPGEFAAMVSNEVARRDASVIVIDSLNGYLNAMQESKALAVQLHEMLAYLGQMGATTILVSVQQGLIGTAMTSAVDASYLADTIIVTRYFEMQGEVRQAISVLKNRTMQHERTIREFNLTPAGLRIGDPLRDFHGVLTGVPTFTGNRGQLIDPDRK
jgi:circadian clock protein KaiC